MSVGSTAERSSRVRLTLLALTAGLVAYHAFAVLAYGTVSLNGIRHFLSDDDVLISMRYARNLARGAGLVFNPGERVEGFTNPLLTLTGALVHLFGVAQNHVPLALDLINLCASAGILALLFSFWNDAPAGAGAGLAAGGLYLLAGQHLFYAHAGYEVYLQGLVLAYGVARFDRIGYAGAFALGALPLTHATSTPSWFILILAMLAFHHGAWRRRLALAALAALLPVGYQIFRLAYYGEWVPNTFWLKVGAGKLTGGIVYARAWLRLVLPSALLAAVSVFIMLRACARRGVKDYVRDPANRRLVVAAVVLLTHLGEVISVGGDYFPLSRFLFPCTVLVAALGGKGFADAIQWIRGLTSRRSQRIAAVGLAGLTMAALAWPLLNFRANDDLIKGRSDWNVHHLTLGLALRDNTPPETSVALFAMGYVGYFGDRPSIDMLGKADRHIARRPANPRRAIAHNKTDFDYVLARHPDLIELALHPPELTRLDALAETSRSNPHGYQAELALNPVFQRDFAPNPVTDVEGRPIRLYARQGAMTASSVRGWRVDEAYFATEGAP